MASRLDLPCRLHHRTGNKVGNIPYFKRRLRYRQQGAFAMMAAVLLVVIVLFCGFALDTGPLYNRKVELSGMAKAVALAAANELNGTSAGIASAQTKARETAALFTYQYGVTIPWDDAALTFSTTPSRGGDWRPGSQVTDASAYYYAKVDTSALGSTVEEVRPIIMPMFSSSLNTIQIDDSAIAGRASVNVVPVAICAMSDVPAAQRVNAGLVENELVEYGFRRGVSYDLMQLNPTGTVAARFLVNPVAGPGVSSSSFNTSTVGPFACVGTMWMTGLKGGSIHVTSLPQASPLVSVYAQLNSRLDNYTGNSCEPSTAPPDTNVKPYPYDATDGKGAPWMNPLIGLPAAHTTTERNRLETVADIPGGSTLPGLTTTWYGPLWAFSKAVKYSSSTAFSINDWSKLYKSGPSTTSAKYPSSQQFTPYYPYGVSNPTTIASPTSAGKSFAMAERRALYVPLLSCTTDGVPSGSNVTAKVAGIGKFYMTVLATPDTLIAEFAGAVRPEALTGTVEIYP